MSRPYAGLSPDRVLDSVEALGLQADGRLLELNSFENRVYQIGLEGDDPVVGKFYRPSRWSDAAIAEEHEFSLALAAAEIPVVAPMVVAGATLHEHEGFRYALFPRRGGRAPELESDQNLEWMGRLIGRIHALGERAPFAERPTLTPQTFGHEPSRWLMDSDWIPPHLEAKFAVLYGEILETIERRFEQVYDLRNIALHGDCHRGNVLWTPDGPHFVDLDDAVNGPAVQDLWMLLDGDRERQSHQMQVVLQGYEQFREFDAAEIALVEPLRALRIIRYAAWLAQRWEDPAFPPAFPWFGSERYWEDHLRTLEEQRDALAEPPLTLST